MEKHITNKTGRHGFALIAAMTIMFLMTGIAVVLYTFSTVAQRSSAIAASRTQAQANARMGLMLALGELQKQMGPDQRVSAPGAIASTDETVIEHLHWTGVWMHGMRGRLMPAATPPANTVRSTVR